MQEERRVQESMKQEQIPWIPDVSVVLWRSDTCDISAIGRAFFRVNPSCNEIYTVLS